MAHVTLGLESDPLDATPEDLQAAKDFTIEKTKNLYSIWVDYTAMWDDVAKGNVWAAYSWPDTYVVLKADQPVQYISPKEGVFTWAEGLILRSDTENYHHAHEFADAWASVEVGQRLVSTWGYGHANTDVDLAQIDPDVVEVFGLDDLETSAVERHLRRATSPSEPSTTAPGTRSRRLRASRVSPRAMATETAPLPRTSRPRRGAAAAPAGGARRAACSRPPRSG